MERSGKILLFTCLCLVATLNIKCQDNTLVLKTGVGIPEVSNVAAGFQLEQAQFILGAGYLPLPEDEMAALFADFYIHLFGSSGYTNIRPWYARAGFLKFREKTPRWIDRYNYLDLRMGRTFNLNSSLAIELDLGVLFELSYDREEIISTSHWISLDFPVFPCIGTRFVYRITV